MARETCVNVRTEAALPSKLEWLRAMPSWAVSAGIHLVLLLILLSIVIETRKPPASDVIITVSVPIAPRPEAASKPYDPLKPRGMESRPSLPVAMAEVDEPFVESHQDDFAASPDPKGLSDRYHSDTMADYSRDALNGLDRGIGVGATIGGPIGRLDGTGRSPEGRKAAPPGSVAAAQAALEWLRRHQGADGSWKSRDFTERCAIACRNADASRHGDGRGFAGHDVGVTGLAILAFTGWGHTHQTGEISEYRECVKKAMLYLKSVQVHSEDPSTNGRLGSAATEQWTYDHAIATMALCELYLMTKYGLLRKPVTDAVRLCIRAQNDGFGWRYGIRPGDNDTSVTGWMVLALKTAKSAGLELSDSEYDRAFTGALRWLGRATSAGGKTGYQAPGDDGSRLSGTFPDPYPYSKELSSMTAVGVLCRLFAGESRASAVVRRGVKLLAENIPRWREEKGRALSTVNFYYWYYGSYAMFQFGGREWTRWDEAMQAALIKSQRQGAQSCEDGSWDPIDEWGPAGGRVYATAMGAMTLEVYYRFERAQDSGRSVFSTQKPK